MPAPEPHNLLTTLKKTLSAVGVDFASVIDQFGQVKASEDRAQGKHFALHDLLRGLVLSLLSNQRPWEPIARNRNIIDTIFFNYDPEQVQATDPQYFVNSLREIQCGNRAIVKQMGALSDNIYILRQIAAEYGSLDEFVESDVPDSIASKLSLPGHYKLKQVGLALALEYLKNVGVRASKPDLHVRRVLSDARLGYFGGHPSEIVASEIMTKLARATESNPTYLDNLLWMFCAKNYGDICGSVPRCSVCGFSSTCNFPEHQQFNNEELPIVRPVPELTNQAPRQRGSSNCVARFNSVIEDAINSKGDIKEITAKTFRQDAAVILESLVAEFSERQMHDAMVKQGIKAKAYHSTLCSLIDVAKKRRPLRLASR
jgi:3-methyladenine DNA glycosylase Tag